MSEPCLAGTEHLVTSPLALSCTWQEGRLTRIRLHIPAQGQRSSLLSEWGEVLLHSLETYADGKPTAWPALPLAWTTVPPFARNVLETLAQTVGWGEWTTYGGLAQACGRPKAARAVGRIMSCNPWPLVVPCHRVLGAGKQLGGFSSGLDQKRLLLGLENIL